MPLTPEQLAKHRALFNTVSTEANDTKTKQERKNEFEQRFGHRVETSTIVNKLLASERIVWIPYRYVLFVRQNTCLHCRSIERGMDTPQLFLCSKRADRRDDSNPYLYTPVKHIEYWRLPRARQLHVTTSPFCLACFDSPSLEEQVEEGKEEATEGENAESLRGQVTTETAFRAEEIVR